MALTNEYGEVVESIIYDGDFGEEFIHIRHETTFNPYGYTGREVDLDDLYYYRARYYDPTTQRFLSQDPIEFEAGDVNFYRYVGNDPVNFVDPSGLQVLRCYRYLGNPNKDSTGILNPARHDYIIVGNKTYSYQATGNFVWSKGVLKEDDEKIDRENCSVIWEDDEHDKYVHAEAKKILNNPPQYGIGPQATDCQEVADMILERASDAYDKANPVKWSSGKSIWNAAKGRIRDLFWYGK